MAKLRKICIGDVSSYLRGGYIRVGSDDEFQLIDYVLPRYVIFDCSRVSDTLMIKFLDNHEDSDEILLLFSCDNVSAPLRSRVHVVEKSVRVVGGDFVSLSDGYRSFNYGDIFNVSDYDLLSVNPRLCLYRNMLRYVPNRNRLLGVLCG